MDIKEIWKPLLIYKGIEVSSFGRIKRYATKRNKERVLSNFPKDKDGYCRCSVQLENGKWTSQPVHRLVALAFIDNINNKSNVNHKDSNRTNNKVTNLEWVTTKENVHHSIKYGNRNIYKCIPKNSILTEFQVSQINKLKEIYTVNQIANIFNVNYLSLKNIIRKRKNMKDWTISSQAEE